MVHIISGKKQETDKKAIKIIEDSISALLKTQKYVVMAVPGGRSVRGVFHLLKLADIPWKKTHIFMVDERLVPIEHDDSNFKLAYESFIKYLTEKGKLPKQNVHPFIIDTTKKDYGLARYKEELIKYGGRYDIVLLGVGEDCHVGALFPNHASVKDDSEYFLILNDSPKAPKKRMTLSRKLLLRSQSVLAFFYSENKRNAFEKFNDNTGYIDCPAQLIKQVKESYALTDLV